MERGNGRSSGVRNGDKRPRGNQSWGLGSEVLGSETLRSETLGSETLGSEKGGGPRATLRIAWNPL